MKRLLLALLFPIALNAQEVEPVLSKDYQDLIHNDSLLWRKGRQTDTANGYNTSHFLLSVPYYGNSVKRIRIQHNEVIIEPLRRSYLAIGGNITSTIEYKKANRLPAIQNQFVQGRSQNGSLVWRGPETGEWFSYGPNIQTLEYDGGNYAFDKNGQLVAAGTGNGHKAQSYSNTILRTAALFTQSVNLQWRLMRSATQKLAGSVKWQQTGEKTIIADNKNNNLFFSTSLEAYIAKHNISGSYLSRVEKFSNSNRNGFLNRVYQNALITPSSFDNAQGATLGTAQRSFNANADNPWFLLDTDGHGFYQLHKAGSLSIEKKGGNLKYNVTQSLEKLQQSSNEIYKPGTAFFSNGIAVNQLKRDVNYLLRGEASYIIDYNNYDFRSTARLNYLYGNSLTTIQYAPGASWRYQRSSHEAAASFLTTYNSNRLETGLTATNKIYASNTTAAGYFFQPSLAGYAQIYDVFTRLNTKLYINWNNYYNELPVDRSYASYNLLQYTTARAFAYFPVTEVSGFDNLQAIRHNDMSARLELTLNYRFTVMGEVFTRNTFNDIFPVFESGQLVLKNIADHRHQGIELTASSSYSNNKWQLYNTVSWYSSRSKVTGVRDGYNNTPVAGFADVHAAIVKGEVLGAIVGNSFQRDASGNVVIGQDGFPVVNTTPTVIGHANPDFVMKMSHTIDYKNWNLGIIWEWKKGGRVWNGTQAVLDYYGRSENSASLRSTTGYVFAGSLQDGHTNTTPVNFYNANEPVENNRFTRYGYSGVASEYMQKADYLALHHIGLSYTIKSKKIFQTIRLSAYVNNVLVWTPYKGVDPRQLLYDQYNTAGLDFFNLPATKDMGCSVSIQF